MDLASWMPAYGDFTDDPGEAAFDFLWKDCMALWAPVITQNRRLINYSPITRNYGKMNSHIVIPSWARVGSPWGHGFDNTGGARETTFDNIPYLAITGPITVMAAISPHTGGSGNEYVTTKWNGTSNFCPYSLIVTDTNNLRFLQKSVAGVETITSSDTLTDNVWYVCFALRNQGNQVTFYINGKQDSGGWQNTNGWIADGSHWPSLMSLSNGTSQFYGKMAICGVWKREMGSAEIELLSINPAAMFIPAWPPSQVTPQVWIPKTMTDYRFRRVA